MAFSDVVVVFVAQWDNLLSVEFYLVTLVISTNEFSGQFSVRNGRHVPGFLFAVGIVQRNVLFGFVFGPIAAIRLRDGAGEWDHGGDIQVELLTALEVHGVGVGASNILPCDGDLDGLPVAHQLVFEGFFFFASDEGGGQQQESSKVQNCVFHNNR
jgi:hypothetical protein